MTSLQQITIGTPVDTLPARKSGTGAATSALWASVAEQVADAEGQWVPLKLPGRTRKSLASTVRHIKSGKLAAFRDGAWDAAMRGDTLWVRSVPAVELKAVA